MRITAGCASLKSPIRCQLILKELRLLGSYTYTDLDFRRAVALVSELPTGFYTVRPLEDGVDFFEQLARGDSQVLKVLLKPDPASEKANDAGKPG